jgi:hypothetical protein
MTARPETCPDCGDWIEYVTDEGGIWAECSCSAGYLA